jgi:hypothetical protein
MIHGHDECLSVLPEKPVHPVLDTAHHETSSLSILYASTPRNPYQAKRQRGKGCYICSILLHLNDKGFSSEGQGQCPEDYGFFKH